MFEESEDDIAADIRSAMTKEDAAPEGVEVSPAQTIEEAPKDQPRAPDGKFAKVEQEVQNTAEEQPAATETEQPSIRPPAAWSAQAKADFATLPPHIQQEVLKRERDMDKGLQDRASQLKRYEPLEGVLAPHRNRLALAGTDEVTYISRLMAADEMLRTNPQDALQQIAAMYGIPYGAQAPGQPYTAQPAQVSPQVDVSALVKQEMDAFREQSEMQRVQSEIEAFASDPANMYFDNVREDMAALVTSGRAGDLKQAYDMACWANPEIRGILIAQQAKDEQARKIAADKQRAEQAKKAAGSVAGSGGHGDTVKPVNQNNSIEDDVREAMAAASGRI